MVSTILAQQRHRQQRWSALLTLTSLVLLASSFWVTVANAGPSPNLDPQSQEQIADGIDLRVLPIGDSITWGAHSTHGNGYRKHLFDKLANRGNDVDFVGGMATGTMEDNNHEGHRAFVIDEITNASTVGIHAAANIVLLHAGTNDMKNDVDPPNAPSRLKNLIDIIFTHAPGAVVFVCQIIPAGPNRYQDSFSRIDDFNAAIPDLVSEYVSEGKKVVMVSMNKALSTADLVDNLHPNDSGYVKMAEAYYSAIELADEKGWISEPGSDADDEPGSDADDEPGSDADDEPGSDADDDISQSKGTRFTLWLQYQLGFACLMILLTHM